MFAGQVQEVMLDRHETMMTDFKISIWTAEMKGQMKHCITPAMKRSVTIQLVELSIPDHIFSKVKELIKLC
ncbi:hypothetical protein E2C01_010851 [Portunus trituberculatus]|uniref:Uncharacterized protein n=1 Tax=Portunus trituberculatus TaxID=210409 RepID=A0A5B7D9I5_PORTR|nr:hypothetical protein [Portunus trituberculatus]